MENENQNEIVESQNTEILPEQRYYNGPVTLEEAESYITSGLVSTARNYVAIGYWLRRIRDGKLYEEEGHQNFEQYVHEKYGKDKGWASKCIKVNQQLSKDGDSPLLDSRYRDYSTYQLVELAYMTEEQREQATPEQTVKQLQEIRKPKEIPYYDIDGQQEMEKDYPEVIPVVMSQLFPEEEIPKQEEQEPPVVEQTEVSQYFETKQEPVPGEPIEAMSAANEPENAAEKQRTGNCLYDPNHLCTLSEEAKRSPGIGEDCANHFCCGCVRPGDCKMECTVSEDHPELQKVLENDVEKQEEEPQDSMTIRGFIKHWKETCPDDFNLTLRAMRVGKDAGEKAKSIQRALAPYGFHCVSCSGYSFEFRSFSGGMDWMVDGRKIHLKYGRLANELLCMYDPYMPQFDAKPVPPTNEPQSSELRSITEDPEKQVDVNSEDYEESDDASSAEITDLQLLRDMLERKKRLLATNLAIPGIDESDEHIRMQKLEVAALASAVCDLENLIEPEETVDEKPEQPELPYLRNNDQRAAFIDAYESWPLWIETKETGERYYRYDLPDGTRFVVKTYHSMLYDYKAGVGMRYKEGYGANEQYILEPGKFFRDCQSNRSSMIEKLKELQKREKES